MTRRYGGMELWKLDVGAAMGRYGALKL